MEITKEVHTAIVVASRMQKSHDLAKSAANKIDEVRTFTGTSFLSEEDSLILKNAANILRSISEKCGVHEIQEYLHSLSNPTS